MSCRDRIVRTIHSPQTQPKPQQAPLVQIEPMPPADVRQHGAGLLIEYGVAATPFGDLFMALTPRGICRAVFVDTDAGLAAGQGAANPALQFLQAQWPLAGFVENTTAVQALVSRCFNAEAGTAAPFRLSIHGTKFQLAVWRALLRVPAGNTLSYGQLAQEIQRPTAARAVGTAVGANPVAVLIPCHRIIRQNGALGGYRWGTERKLALLDWERRTH
jgi:AraC family transcriptional regulator, regulatory protein of adaptative response / methylated-DNA-[protein]-cysteine methyltransferase